jgi:hypothetical protein
MVFYTRRAKVTTWYTAPTAIRRLTYGGHKARSTISKSQIDFKCGEPLNAEAVIWGEEILTSFGQLVANGNGRYYDSQLSFEETRFHGKTFAWVEIAIVRSTVSS